MVPATKLVSLNRRTFTAGLSLLLVLLWGFSCQGSWVEAVYSSWIYPAIFWILGSLTGWIPVSLAEISLGCTLISLLLYIVWRAGQLWTGNGHRTVLLIRCLWDLILASAFVAALFYLLWGLNYGRPPLSQRMAWEPPPETAEELRRTLPELAAQAVELTNQAFRECFSSFTLPSRPRKPLADLNSALNGGMEIALDRLNLGTPRLGSNRAKSLLASELMNYLGVAGFYFPWTGEANFNGSMLPLEAVHSMAHEKAHQIGLAQEDEANFMGFLACIHSGDRYARYSGYYFASGQLLSLLRRVDPESWREVRSELDPGVLEDQNYLREFWRRYEGPTREVATAVNNAHLRLNRVPGGIYSYGRSVQLILQWAATNGESLEVRR